MSQNCYRHPTILSHVNCADCGQPICAACVQVWRGATYCLPDYALARYPHITQSQPVLIVAAPAPPPVIQRMVATAPRFATSPFVALPARDMAIPHRIVAPLTNPESLSADPPTRRFSFTSPLWSLLGLIASAAEMVFSLSFFRLLEVFYSHRNSHDNSYLMKMALFQAFILMFLLGITAFYSVLVILTQRANWQVRTALPFRRLGQHRISPSILSILFGGAALVICIGALIALATFIFDLGAIHEGLQCCG